MSQTPYEAEMTKVLDIWHDLMIKENNGYPLSPEEGIIKLSLSNLIRARSHFLEKLFYAEGDKIERAVDREDNPATEPT